MISLQLPIEISFRTMKMAKTTVMLDPLMFESKPKLLVVPVELQLSAPLAQELGKDTWKGSLENRLHVKPTNLFSVVDVAVRAP